MKKFLLLVKVCLITDLNPSKILKRQSTSQKKKSIGAVILVFILAVFILSYSTFYSFMIAGVLAPLGLMELLLLAFIIITSFMVCLTCIYKAQGHLFGSSDLNILLSLPVRQWQVMLSKLVSLYIENIVFTFFLIAPATGVYYYFVKPSILFFLIMLLVWLFVPLIPMILSIVFAFCVSLFTSKSRFKNLLNIVITLTLLVGAMLFSSNIMNIYKKIVSEGQTILNGVKKIYPPAGFASEAAVHNDFLKLLLYMLICVVPFAFFVYILSKGYKFIVSRSNVFVRGKSNKKIKITSESVVKALFFKEIGRYFSSAMYVLNTGIGMVFMTMFSFGIVFFGKNTIATLLEIPALKDAFPQMLIIMFSLFIVLSATTPVSISLEGKNLWILQSNPINPIDVFTAKIMLNLLITVPITVINGALLCIFLKPKISEVIFIFVIPILFAFITAVFGLFINLLLPKLEWKNEIMVIKQSMSLMVSLALNAALVAIPTAIYIFLASHVMTFSMYASILSIVLILFLYIIWNGLKTKGVMLFKKLG